LRPALDWTIKTQKKSENKMNCSYNAVADGLHALIGVSRKAVGAALTRSESHQLAA
jgi:hypothetical protein